MFEITDLAASNLRAYLDQNKVDSAIRIALMQGGCSGPSLGLALDEAKASDKVFEEGTLKFLVDGDLLDRCGTVKVDFIDAGYRSGFAITSANSLGTGGGCCSGGSCGGSCG
jgi:iron-sulfur cluster assembly accessory protein